MIRVSEGKYRVGDNLTLIFVRVSIQLVNVLVFTARRTRVHSAVWRWRVSVHLYRRLTYREATDADGREHKDSVYCTLSCICMTA